jgi:hypothetical protein
MAERWCTVTVTDAHGRRHSLDVLATSTYDAAHLYVTHAKTQQQSRIPVPTVETRFEVVSDGRIYRVPGEALQRWIASCAARDVNVSGRHTLGSALVMASSRCGVEDVQRGSLEVRRLREGID